ncbi:energy transducer TonB [Pseudoalteromonas denitrificans]|uniref:Protein TonB n=1 Tax=Pseudoalteromonas denitrificans DSM 6059 TaxID=1123010 RepID=A0A1I1E9A2_9GAMM|nr:energy transducer TonB [Pseudoalteromonas denitrificans]SFB83705.1 outer membrane transport energization protein TonB [Pseudoalteromonas denitrificans DSM 6059]
MTFAINQSPLYKSAKFSSFILGATLTTLVTFAFMHYLIKNNYTTSSTPPPPIVIDVISEPEIKKVTLRDRMPPPPQIKPQPPRNIRPQVESIAQGGQLTHYTPSLSQIEPKINMPTMLSSGQGGATPLVRISPKYPIKAAREGKQGWVQIGFTISEIGTVTSPFIINSEPKRLFDKAALRAIRKWKYKPKMINGKTVKQTNQSIQLDFKIDQAL